jgi:endonuclease YncB( thermonuclease family)
MPGSIDVDAPASGWCSYAQREPIRKNIVGTYLFCQADRMFLADPPPIVCVVTHVHDGDGPLWCLSGEKIRVAGIQAPDFESAAPCKRAAERRRSYVCDDRAAALSQRIMSGLVFGKRLVCRPVDVSYRRTVARCTLPDGRSLSCAALAAGAAIRWDRYWTRYGMGSCR